MTGNFERGALIFSVGFVMGIVLLTVSIKKNTAILSKSLERAGSNSRGSYSASFPSSLRIQTTEKEQDIDIPIERRRQLADALAAACVGKVYQGKKVQKVEIEGFYLENSGWRISFRGNLVFDDGSKYENFNAVLSQDGLGGYKGSVRSPDKKEIIIGSIKIQ